MQFKQTEQFKKYRAFVLEYYLDHQTYAQRDMVRGMFYGFKPFFDAQGCGYMFNDFLGYVENFFGKTPSGIRERYILRFYDELFDNIGKYYSRF